ncbi:Ribosomal protein S18 acetylase RimI [Algoriphagus ornithinivorans]|uniref:Ribosomal protein S18 acetylase RimI n=1 Tax=Algoriphagus ornithinivorans TaxID=226506 RepID=A0A1I5HIW3_9BACT|nr:GNAT family N-acetyltransferase [Algoriphagus ornithinivorans]SFO48278.1 Ribosomal protein S18 acetylase RimI [Algoriphagus ornithinivorans]
MITSLPFDSELFGYPVGKYQVSENWNEAEFREIASDFQLVYLFSKFQLDLNSPEILETDRKVVFEKILEHNKENRELVKEYQGPLTDDLITLAYASGEYSRFKTDQRLKFDEFEKLYQVWIGKALERTEVLIFGEMEGMLTCEVKENTTQIGLFAVKESSRGKGIGESLLIKAESRAFEKGANKIMIATQEKNIPATSLYRKMGYKIASKTFIYHYWNEEFKARDER